MFPISRRGFPSLALLSIWEHQRADEDECEYSILIYVQQDKTLHNLFYLETALHVSGGTTTHNQERKQLYLQHLVFATPLLLSAAIVEELEML